MVVEEDNDDHVDGKWTNRQTLRLRMDSKLWQKSGGQGRFIYPILLLSFIHASPTPNQLKMAHMVCF